MTQAISYQSRWRDTPTSHRYSSVRRVIEHMTENLDHPHTLESMAEVGAFSPFHFNRIFREVTGLPPGKFLCALRIAEAKRLLLTSDMQVINVCYEVGYNSLGSFGKRFRPLVGVAPRELRANAARLDSQDIFTLLRSFRTPDRPGFGSHRRQHARVSGIEGTVTQTSPRAGLILVGVFRSLLISGEPVACIALARPGTFNIPSLPDGTYYIAATMLELFAGSKVSVHQNLGLRSSVGPVRIKSGQADQPIELALREPSIVDPPILPAFWLLFHAQLGKQAPAPGIARKAPLVSTVGA